MLVVKITGEKMPVAIMVEVTLIVDVVVVLVEVLLT